MVRETVKDDAVTGLIKKFLKSGVMAEGIVSRRELGLTSAGMPQGGNLPPLLSNIYLTKFDKMLEERGHKFVRTKVRSMRMMVTSTTRADAPHSG
jgi:retron-type reverse transcriptase